MSDTDAISSLVIDETQRVSDWNLCVDGEITSITTYRDSDGSLWFSVWAGDKVVKRINGRFVVEVNHVR